MNAQILTGHPAKLRDGTWGAHVNSSDAKCGDVVHIETRNGKQWTETVDKVIWIGRDGDGNECALVTCVPREVGAKGRGASKKPKVARTLGAAVADGDCYDDDDLP